MNHHLAINGGCGIATYDEWPKWPLYSSSFINALALVLQNRRWTVSGPYTGTTTFDEKFCKAFARYNDNKYALTVDHGTTAIVLALCASAIEG